MSWNPHEIAVDVSERRLCYRNFIIEGAYESGVGNVWEWTHEDYSHGSTPQYLQASGNCRTIFEAVAAVDAWHDGRECGGSVAKVIAEARRRNEQEAILRDRARSFIRHARKSRLEGDRRFAADNLDMAAEDRLELMRLQMIVREFGVEEHRP